MLAVVLADLVDGHDVRVVEVGRRLRLGAEALHVGRRRQLAGQDHLEGDDAVQAHLPRLVDDAHAAAGDLLQQLVVAEVAHRRPRGHGRALPGCQGRRGAERLGQAAKLVLVGEEGPQFPGEVGVPAQQLVSVGSLAETFRLQVVGQDAVDALFALARNGGFVGHESLPVGRQLSKLFESALGCWSPRRVLLRAQSPYGCKDAGEGKSGRATAIFCPGLIG